MIVADIKSGAREPWHKAQLACYVIGAPNPLIRFEEEGHRYYAGDQELVSVTKLVGEKSEFYAPGSANRGHLVHRICTLDGQGVLDDTTVDPLLMGYLTAWRKFRRETGVKFLAFEQIVGDIDLGFAGRRDFVADGPDGKALLLYLRKTGRYTMDWLMGPELAQKIAEVKQRARDYHEARRLEMFA